MNPKLEKEILAYLQEQREKEAKEKEKQEIHGRMVFVAGGFFTVVFVVFVLYYGLLSVFPLLKTIEHLEVYVIVFASFLTAFIFTRDIHLDNDEFLKNNNDETN